MHPQHIQHSHLARRAASLGDEILRHASAMAPRSANSLPNAGPNAHEGQGPVAGFGEVLNLTSSAAPFTHGLAGVDQAANWLFANILVISFMGMLAITLIYRWIHMGNAHARHLFTMGRDEDQRYWMYNHSYFWPRLKKNVLLAPLGRVRHNKEIQLSNAISMGTLPSRFHMVLLLLYCLSNIAYCLVLDWHHQNSAAVVADLRGRTGVLAALNLIPTVLFALRNNPLIPILRVSYDTFNLLHRWCARIVVLETIVHTLCWAVNALQAGGLKNFNLVLSTSVSYQWGMVAACIFTFIAITAISPVRHAFYETFLNAHRILVAVGLVGVYIHLEKANLPQLPYIQLCMAMWWFEWVWRSMRILFYNLSRRKGLTKVTVEALPAEACRVTFELSRPWRWTPGCHVHAYLPAYALWSSHPFSVAWADTPAKKNEIDPVEIEMEKITSPNNRLPGGTQYNQPPLHTRYSTISRRSIMTSNAGAPLGAVESKQQQPAQSTSVVTHRPDATSVSLIIRARTGMTRKLFNKANATPTGKLTTWGAIEGPYGGHETFASYGTVILFAGGVGITHCIGFVHHLLQQHQLGTCSTQKILLVWSVPNTEALEWVRVWMDRILRMEHRREVLRIQLFVTKPRHRGEVISNTGSVQMFPGRCNPQTIIEKEIPERIGAVGVTACGPGAFADSVRSAVRGVITEASVDFIEEAFTY